MHANIQLEWIRKFYINGSDTNSAISDITLQIGLLEPAAPQVKKDVQVSASKVASNAPSLILKLL